MPETNEKCINCFWWDCFACDGKDEDECPYRISPNNDIYHTLYTKYDEKMAKKLEKLYKEYKKYFEIYKMGKNN